LVKNKYAEGVEYLFSAGGFFVFLAVFCEKRGYFNSLSFIKEDYYV